MNPVMCLLGLSRLAHEISQIIYVIGDSAYLRALEKLRTVYIHILVSKDFICDHFRKEFGVD